MINVLQKAKNIIEDWKIILFINFLGIHFKNKRYENNIDYDSLQIYLNNHSLHENYHELIKNLDNKSKDVVDTVIFRNMINKSFFSSSFLTNKEKKEFYKPFNSKVSLTQLPFKKHELFYRNIYPGFNYYEIPVFKFHHGLRFFGNNLNNYLNNKDLIDGGAFDLSSAVCLLSCYPFKRAFCFEISKNIIENSRKTLNSLYPNLSDKIISINEGLWDKKSKAVIDTKSKNGLAAYFRETLNQELDTHEDTIINLNSLDSFINSSKLDLNVGLIKFDIEGSEYKAILGAKESIFKHHPVLLIAIYHNYTDFFKIKPLIEEFVPNIYDFYIRKIAPGINPLDTYLICIPKKLNIQINNLEETDIYG